MKDCTKFKKLVVTGGDLRFVSVANRLSDKGYEVYVFSICSTKHLRENITVCSGPEECICDADAVILPLPCTTDGINISGTDLMLSTLFELMPGNALLLGGKIPEGVYHSAEEFNLSVADYFSGESTEIKNAVPTAEGALALAISQTLTTIHGSDCLVLGFGRIGKILSGLLRNMGAKVFVAARKKSDIAWIGAMGYTPLDINDSANLAGDYTVIFNTVPFCILNKDILSRINPETLIIDLASKPGGVDFCEAKRLGINAIHALSLPGKIAPVTAGNIICDEITGILTERSNHTT